MPALIVIRPGLLTTIQDLGRWGHQDRGVPVAGPMDEYSHRLANRIVGNDDNAAALEATLIGPELQAEGDVACAVAGAVFPLTIDGAPAPMHRLLRLKSGSRLRFGMRRAGARATLAVGGGIDVEPVLGSRATSLPGEMGPFGGRPLAAGDRLPVGLASSVPREMKGVVPLQLPNGGVRLRAIPGPHGEMFGPGAYETLFGSRYVVTANSNRMGYRLDGPPLELAGPADILSEATPVGSIQVPASGLPILLMADRQTTGGYPRIATVISADLPRAGQLAPGDWIEFAPCTREAAIDLARRQRSTLAGLSA